MQIKDYKCKCGHNDFFFADKGSQKGIYCTYCGKWVKWADKDGQLKELDYGFGEKIEPCEDADVKLIHTQGLDEGIRCAMCTNSMKSDRGCDGSCVVNKNMYKAVMDTIEKCIQPTTKNDLYVTPQEPCEDAISRQAVLDLAKKGVLVSNGNYESVCKAINEIPSVNLMPCEDAISRDAVKELIKCGESTDTYDDVEQVCKWIDALPSVTQKSGNWIEHGFLGDIWFECDQCSSDSDSSYNYCPNCGAKMESDT